MEIVEYDRHVSTVSIAQEPKRARSDVQEDYTIRLVGLAGNHFSYSPTTKL